MTNRIGNETYIPANCRTPSRDFNRRVRMTFSDWKYRKETSQPWRCVERIRKTKLAKKEGD